jgi:hypothetical protein
MSLKAVKISMKTALKFYKIFFYFLKPEDGSSKLLPKSQ